MNRYDKVPFLVELIQDYGRLALWKCGYPPPIPHAERLVLCGSIWLAKE